jgi:branched-chain amino acid transport system substrate-binding protein
MLMMVKRDILLGGLRRFFSSPRAPSARPTVVIGVALPRTGSVASIGDQVFNGATAAARDINAKGGVNGEKVVLDVQDDVCDPKQAVSVANKFVQSGVKLVVGHVCSGASIVASEIYAENGIVMISPASNSARLTDRGLPGIFRVCGRDDQQGQLSAQIIASDFRAGRSRSSRQHALLPRARRRDQDEPEQGRRHRGAVQLDHAGRARLHGRDHPAQGGGDRARLLRRLPPGDGAFSSDRSRAGFRAQWLGTSGIASKEFAAIAGRRRTAC